MQDIKSLFTHRCVYLLPDETPVVALWIEALGQPRWRFLEQLPDGRLGNLIAAVMPNGSVWNYRLVPDPSHPDVCVPYPSDLAIEDFRRANAPRPICLTRFGGMLAAAWLALSADDLWFSLLDAVAALQMTA